MSDEFKLEKSMWQSGGYYYLNKEDSDLYDKLKNSDDEKDKQIIKLIVDKARTSSGHHAICKY